MTAYNMTPHDALEGLTPQEAAEKKNGQFIRELNSRKNVISNHFFKEGQFVRKKLARPTFAKGYKRVWSQEVHILKQVKGVNGVLENGDVVKLNDLQVIPNPNEKAEEPAKETRVERLDKAAKVDKVLKSVGIDQTNLVEGARIRRAKKIFDL